MMSEQPKSETKHTAGPWAWDQNTWWGVLHGPEVNGVRQDVCAFSFCERSEWPHVGNRALIAAAPNLLAMCEKLADALKSVGHYAALQEAARIEIAKAKETER